MVAPRRQLPLHCVDSSLRYLHTVTPTIEPLMSLAACSEPVWILQSLSGIAAGQSQLGPAHRPHQDRLEGSIEAPPGSPHRPIGVATAALHAEFVN